MTDDEILCALIGQVADAARPCHSELEVTTLITRPMWNAFLRATKTPENTAPTAWLGIGKTHRVYGSETIVVERADFASVSFRR